jgi:superfamily II DNA or RNA helicase
MARLAAIEKGLYYPTPSRVIDMIARMVRPHEGDVSLFQPSCGNLLDPCAGEGTAAAHIARAWGMGAYGVELDATRAATAATKMNCLRGSYHQLRTTPDYTCLYLNPPYDEGLSAEGQSIRQEVQFLRDCTEWLAPGGLLVYIVPKKILRNDKALEILQRKFCDIAVWQFPEPEYGPFKQVVILARKSSGYYSSGNTDALRAEVLPVLDDTADYRWRPPSRATYRFYIELEGDNPIELCPDTDEGVFGSKAWDLLVGQRGAVPDRPLVAPRPGHRAMLLAAGSLDGAELEGNKLLKGGSEKVIESTTELSINDEGCEVKTTIERERIVSRLAVLDLATGDCDAWRVDQEADKTAAWFAVNGPALAEAIIRCHTPAFDGDLNPYRDRLAKLTAPGILPGRDKPEILTIQAETAAAVVHRWKRNKTAIVSGEMGTGKAQPLTAKVLTPTGWKQMGDVQVGDKVTNPAGGTSTVIGVYPQGVKPVYRVTFCDGTSTECCDDHLWSVNTAGRRFDGRPARVKPLREIRSRLHDINGNRLHFIPLVQPVEFDPKGLPLDPYLLGALLGDGGLTGGGIKFTTADLEMVAELRPLLPKGVAIKPVSGYDYGLTTGRTGGKQNPITVALRNLGLMEHGSESKFIPSTYLHATAKTRTALLQGLLDTDGGLANPIGTNIEYSSVSKQLAEDVQSLVQSLGGVATMATKTPTYTYKGEKLEGQLAYRVGITLPVGIQPFRLTRKLIGYWNGTKYIPTRSIESVEAVGDAECQCIQVDSPDGLYVTDNYIVTHNTTIATVACELRNLPKVVVVCPGHLTSKWKREVEKITGRKGTAMIAKKLSDLDSFFEGPASYLILSKETAKLGCRWVPSFAIRKIRISREVIDTEHPSYRSWGGYQPKKWISQILEVVACPDCGMAQRVKDGPYFTIDSIDAKVKTACLNTDCKSPLWQVAPLSAQGTMRWPLAERLSQKYARRYSLIIDEVHQYAGADSDQSRAVQDLVSGARKVLAMTGTLYGGRASSIFFLLFKVEPSFRAQYGYSDSERFSTHHGLFETKFETKETISTYGYKRGGKEMARTREIPGMAPAMVPLLLPYTVFVKLRDLRLELPPYSEEVQVVDHVPAVESAVRRLQEEIKKVLREHPEALGAYLQACLGYPDLAEQAEDVQAHDSEGRAIHLASAPAFELPDDGMWPKDKKVVDLAVAEREAGRKTLVFCTQVHRRDARPRLRAALEAQGLRVAVMDSSVQPDKREAWLTAAADTCDVLITNGKLVETGLDLLAFQTIIQYGIEYSLATLRQSIRRSWRLGQREPVKVVFLGYRGTMQETALNLIARKMRAAELVDGDEAGGLAQFDAGGSDFFLELAHEAIVHAEGVAVRRAA